LYHSAASSDAPVGEAYTSGCTTHGLSSNAGLLVKLDRRIHEQLQHWQRWQGSRSNSWLQQELLLLSSSKQVHCCFKKV
jgi:hypothetical protein